VAVKPGKHRVTIIETDFFWLPIGPKHNIDVSIKPGSVQYVRVLQYSRGYADYPPVPLWTLDVQLVGAKTALTELRK
jgi:hypothetical protein